MLARNHVLLLLMVWLPGLLPAQSWEEIRFPGFAGPVPMAYDGIRGRMVLLSREPTQRWEFTGGRWTQNVSAAALPPDHNFQCATDAARARLVALATGIYSGNSSTWEFDGSAWQQIATATPIGDVSIMGYDQQRQRTLMLRWRDRMPGELFEYDGATWTGRATIAAPVVAGYGRAATYDSHRRRIVLVAATSNQGSCATWELDLATATWMQTTPAWSPPSRAGVLAFDPLRHRTVLFGGAGGAGILNDTWEYDGTAWTQVWTPHLPQGRYGHVMIFDPSRGRVVMSGGQNTNYWTTCTRETWEYDGQDWRMIAGSPDVQQGGALSFDPARRCVVKFGGYTPWNTYDRTTWEWNGLVWRQVETTQHPGAFGWTAYDLRGRRSLLVQGSDTWAFAGTDWTRVQSIVTPSFRYNPTLATDTWRGCIVLHGGTDGIVAMRDTWEFADGQWQLRSPQNAPPAMDIPCMAFDSSRGHTVLFGKSWTMTRGETWHYDGNDWSLHATATTPTPQHSAAMVFDAVRARVVMAGGFRLDADNYYGALDATWTYDGSDWQRLAMTAELPPTMHHAMAYDSERDRIVLFGGTGGHYADIRGTFELIPSAKSSWARHGNGCHGSAGTPSLDLAGTSLPTSGRPLALQLTNLPLQPTLVALLHGFSIAQWNGAPLPIEPGLGNCLLWIAPESTAPSIAVGTAGTAAWSLPIPNLPSLAGTRLALQAVVLDSLASNGLGTLSNAGIAVIQ